MPDMMYPEDDVIPSPTDEVIVLFYFLGIFSPPF